MRLTATRKASSPCETCRGEHRHLVAQVALQFLHVRPMDGPPAAQVPSPLRDLLFERRAVGGDRHAVHAFIQMPRSVLVHDLPLLPLRRELRPARPW